MDSLTVEQHEAVDEIYEEYMRVLCNQPTRDDLRKIAEKKEKQLLHVLGRKRFMLFKKQGEKD